MRWKRARITLGQRNDDSLVQRPPRCGHLLPERDDVASLQLFQLRRRERHDGAYGAGNELEPLLRGGGVLFVEDVQNVQRDSGVDGLRQRLCCSVAHATVQYDVRGPAAMRRCARRSDARVQWYCQDVLVFVYCARREQCVPPVSHARTAAFAASATAAAAAAPSPPPANLPPAAEDGGLAVRQLAGQSTQKSGADVRAGKVPVAAGGEAGGAAEGQHSGGAGDASTRLPIMFSDITAAIAVRDGGAVQTDGQPTSDRRTTPTLDVLHYLDDSDDSDENEDEPPAVVDDDDNAPPPLPDDSDENEDDPSSWDDDDVNAPAASPGESDDDDNAPAVSPGESDFFSYTKVAMLDQGVSDSDRERVFERARELVLQSDEWRDWVNPNVSTKKRKLMNEVLQDLAEQEGKYRTDGREDCLWLHRCSVAKELLDENVVRHSDRIEVEAQVQAASRRRAMKDIGLSESDIQQYRELHRGPSPLRSEISQRAVERFYTEFVLAKQIEARTKTLGAEFAAAESNEDHDKDPWDEKEYGPGAKALLDVNWDGSAAHTTNDVPPSNWANTATSMQRRVLFRLLRTHNKVQIDNDDVPQYLKTWRDVFNTIKEDIDKIAPKSKSKVTDHSRLKEKYKEFRALAEARRMLQESLSKLDRSFAGLNDMEQADVDEALQKVCDIVCDELETYQMPDFKQVRRGSFTKGFQAWQRSPDHLKHKTAQEALGAGAGSSAGAGAQKSSSADAGARKSKSVSAGAGAGAAPLPPAPFVPGFRANPRKPAQKRSRVQRSGSDDSDEDEAFERKRVWP